MLELNSTCEKPELLSPLALAFVGDAVFSLLVRTQLVQQANRPAKKLHEASAQQVRASAQADAFVLLEPLLDDMEREIMRRGRNAHTGTIPKSASRAQYQRATGLEALFGWLYLAGKTQRIFELFNIILQKGQAK